MKYYTETIKFDNGGAAPNGVFVFPPDQKLALYQDVGKNMQGFVNNQNKWQSAFANA